MGFPRLKKRRSFLAAAGSGERFSSGAFLLQSKKKPEENEGHFFGFTATRRLGNAVKRNRAKRRLRAAVELTLQECFFLKNKDYVLIARSDIFTIPFDRLIHSLKKGLHFLSQEKAK